jgi:hypothetical protein
MNNQAPVILENTRSTFNIDTSHAPGYVLVSGFGLFNVEMFYQTRDELAQVMDQVVGPGRRFCPIIFDMSCGRPDRRVNLPDLRRAEKALIRRYDRVLLIYQDENNMLMEFFVSLFKALVPGTQQVASMDEALRRLGIEASSTA